MAGKSLDIAHALDVNNTTQTSKSSSFGMTIGALKVPGITSGQNNWASVYQGQVTSLTNGHISQIAPLVQIKGGAALAVGDIPNATLGTILQSTLDAAKEKMSQPTTPVVNASSCQKDNKPC